MSGLASIVFPAGTSLAPAVRDGPAVASPGQDSAPVRGRTGPSWIVMDPNAARGARSLACLPRYQAARIHVDRDQDMGIKIRRGRLQTGLAHQTTLTWISAGGQSAVGSSRPFHANAVRTN